MHKTVIPTRYGTGSRVSIWSTSIAVLAGTTNRRFLKECDQYATMRCIKVFPNDMANKMSSLARYCNVFYNKHMQVSIFLTNRHNFYADVYIDVQICINRLVWFWENITSNGILVQAGSHVYLHIWGMLIPFFALPRLY